MTCLLLYHVIGHLPNELIFCKFNMKHDFHSTYIYIYICARVCLFVIEDFKRIYSNIYNKINNNFLDITFWSSLIASIMQLGGPKWDVKLGRRDSKTASLKAANSGVIPPPNSTLSNLINRFKAKGLSTKDMVALSGMPLSLSD